MDLLLFVGLAILPASLAQINAGVSPRERISINSDWRFQAGDPAGMSANLLYDELPEVEESADGKAADARPEAAAKVVRKLQSVLKPWILPTGNAMIKDPARRHVRPDGNPGGAVSFVQNGFSDHDWRSVDLPHDWAIEGPFLVTGPYGGMGRLKSWGVGWYRKKLDIPTADKGKSIFLDVDGAMSYATVWLNGHLVGGWPYGYSSWRVDLTPYVVPGGSNQLAIRLENLPDSARWYPGAGLYRNVWLTKTQPVHVRHWGTVVTTPQVSKTSATVELEVSIDNDGKADTAVDVSTEIYALDDDGKRIGAAVAAIGPARAPIAGKATVSV